MDCFVVDIVVNCFVMVSAISVVKKKSNLNIFKKMGLKMRVV